MNVGQLILLPRRGNVDFMTSTIFWRRESNFLTSNQCIFDYIILFKTGFYKEVFYFYFHNVSNSLTVRLQATTCWMLTCTNNSNVQYAQGYFETKLHVHKRSCSHYRSISF